MKSIPSVLSCVVVSLLIQTIAIAADEAEEDVESRKRIFQAWTKRQNDLQSFQCTGKLNRSDSLANMLPEQREVILKNYPDTKNFFRSVHNFTVRIDGELFDYRLDTVDAEKSNGMNGSRQSYDGKVSQHYTGKLGEKSVGSGVITAEKHAYGPRDFQLLPIILFLRPLHPTLGKIDESYHCRPERIALGDASCHVLEQLGNRPSRFRLWIDPDDGDVLRRIELLMDQRSIEMNIKYHNDPKHGPIPRSWQAIYQTNNGEILFQTACELLSSEFNQQIDIKEFRIDFPPGTYVEDRAANKTYTVPARKDNESKN